MRLPALISHQPSRHVLLLIVIAQIAVGVTAMREKPMFEDRSDEVGHLNMARFVATEHRLPGAADIPNPADPLTQQYSQPPAYYVALAPIVALIDDGKPIPGQPLPNAVCSSYNSNVTGWARPRTFNVADSGAVRVGALMRVVQLLLAVATTTVIYRVARRLFPAKADVALCAAALYAFIPTLVSTTAYIGNDLPVILIGALALDVATSTRRRRTRFILLLALAALAALTKSTGWSLFILLLPPLVSALTNLRRRRYTGRLIAAIALTFVILIGLNFATTGSLIGRYPTSWLQSRNSLDRILTPTLNDLWGSILQTDSIGGITVRGMERLQMLSLLVVGVSLIFLIYRLLRSKALARALTIPALLVAAALALTLIRNLTAPSDIYIFAPFRYLGPAIPALAILVAAALSSFPAIIGVRRLVMLAVPLAWLILSALTYTAAPTPNAERAAAVAGWTLPADATPVTADQPNAPLRVAGYALDPNDRLDDGVASLTLYLAAPQAPTDDIGALELNVGDSPCIVLPVRGLRPTSSFQPGEMVAARVDLPYCGSDADDPVDVDLRWRKSSADGAATVPLDLPPLRLFSLDEPIHRAANCWPDLGTFGGNMQIIKADVPSTFSGGALSVSVNWWATEAITTPYRRIYLVRDKTGSEIARCDTEPRNGVDPTNRWQAGEIIFDDRCALTIPEAQPGTSYSIWIGLTNPADGHFLSHSGSDPDTVQLGTSTAQ